MEVNTWLAILSAVLGLVAFYLRYYTQATIVEAAAKITTEFRDALREIRGDIHALDSKLSRLEGIVERGGANGGKVP